MTSLFDSPSPQFRYPYRATVRSEAKEEAHAAASALQLEHYKIQLLQSGWWLAWINRREETRGGERAMEVKTGPTQCP
ncbi:hypothetical protein R1flu_010495 [Riccia fluitans]|uniref:Uncharacterized protein n=1 Tax=Riccia fluitans TaxID=41844 RepID=A0ABD1Z593_9MARC